ncbi:MAG: NAD(P)-dependent oxidoreductase [Planctomycetaceae bacterium]|jgi:3-hydroxyisobutyrate dehydrogenase|nr:NAD(P)-dependent oxidoreductase [Planctomycetaceae bacterium]
MQQKLGWIGTGIMGCAMAGHLLKAGYPLSVFNRTKSKAQPLLDTGAAWCHSPHEVAENSDIVFHIVGYPADVREVILGTNGTLSGIVAGKIYPVVPERKKVIVDMTTSSPALAVELEAKCKERGVISLDAPVTGGDVGAKNATLSIMIGGDEAAANELMPIWNVLGKTAVYHGRAGNGQHTKMVNQTLLAGNMIGVCESLLYARWAGLDLEKVLQSVSTGAAGSWALSNMAPRILQGDYAPGFLIEHFIKDLRIVLEEAKRMNLQLRGIELAEQFYAAAVEQGYARDGSQALYKILDKIVGVSQFSVLGQTL